MPNYVLRSATTWSQRSSVTLNAKEAACRVLLQRAMRDLAKLMNCLTNLLLLWMSNVETVTFVFQQLVRTVVFEIDFTDLRIICVNSPGISIDKMCKFRFISTLKVQALKYD